MADLQPVPNDRLPAITLQPVTADNWLDCIALDVAADQRAFVASNLFSIAQAQFYPTWTALAIYQGDKPVGFLLMGQHHAGATTYWLFRFMIDQGYQRRGYGRAAMQRLIERLRQQPNTQELKLSYEEENIAAERFYAGLGFEPSGRIDEHGNPVASGGEVVMRLAL